MTSVNSTPANGVYAGVYNAFTGVGGFSTTRVFDTITFNAETNISSYDTTNALEVTFDVRTLNSLIGITKDASNHYVTSTTFSASGGSLGTDFLNISAGQFIAGMKASQVTSVGNLSTLYSDYMTYVKTYFGYAGGFATLFSGAETFVVNGGVFDASAVNTLISSTSDATTDGSGASITNLAGNINLSNLTKLIRYAVDTDCFGNRTGSGNNMASDPSNNNNYGVEDGFIAGDLIFIPAGLVVTLNLGIALESYTNVVNNIGPTNVAALTQTTNFTNGFFNETTQSSLSLITRTVTAPILIRLANLS